MEQQQNPALDSKKGEREADKTRQLAQESSLIICGFSCSSDVERSELQSYYEMISQNVKPFPDLQGRGGEKKMSKKAQREYSGVSVFLPRSPWGLISDHTENGGSLPP